MRRLRPRRPNRLRWKRAIWKASAKAKNWKSKKNVKTAPPRLLKANALTTSNTMDTTKPTTRQRSAERPRGPATSDFGELSRAVAGTHLFHKKSQNITAAP